MTITPGKKYRHIKTDGEYEVVDFATLKNGDEDAPCVIYRSVVTRQLYVRTETAFKAGFTLARGVTDGDV